jgi:hypothetical protein
MSVSYQTRFAFPAYLERGVSNTTELAVWSGASLVAPTAGTYSLYDSAGLAIVDAQNVTVTNQVATYAVTPASTLAVGEGYREEWALTLDGVARYFRREAAVVRRSLWPVVTNADLLTRHPELASVYPPGQSSWGAQIDEAMKVVIRRLIAAGRRPYLVTSSDAFYETELYLTLELVFRMCSTFASGGPGRYLELASYYEKLADKAWDAVRLEYDDDHDGDSDVEGEPTSGVIYLSNPPGYSVRRWGR